MEAHPKKGLTRDIALIENGVTIATIKPSRLKEAANLETGEKSYKLKRERLMSGAFLVMEGNESLAKAIKPSAFHSHFNIEYDGETFLLKRPKIIGRTFELWHGKRVIGEIRPKGPFTMKTDLELPTAWPVAVKAFVFWLAYIIWTRDTSSAAA